MTSMTLNSPQVRLLTASLPNQRLHLILLPTEQCNFRCTYCYEDFTVGRMPTSVVEGVKRLIDRRMDGLRTLDMSWFGGEPLLALPVVEEVSAYIARRAAARPDLSCTAEMTTNGYTLDAATAERLAGLGIGRYQISLDGPQEMHDRSRVRADGKGSFTRIWKNLLDIRKSTVQIHVTLRIHLTAANLVSMPDFLRRIRETFLRDSRFSVRLKPVEHLGGPNDQHIGILPEEDRSRVLAELTALVSSDESGDLDGLGSLTSQAEVCYASLPDSLVIRADGSVGKCTVALTDPANIIGKLLPDGTLSIDNTRLRPWLRGWFTEDREALTCPYQEMPRSNQSPLLQITSR